MGYIQSMKQIVPFTLALMLAFGPAVAQDQDPSEDSDVQEGMDLLSEGTKLLLRGLLAEVEPAMRELQDALQNLNNYYPPEVLPNGDIIIRRKPTAKIDPPEEGEIDI